MQLIGRACGLVFALVLGGAAGCGTSAHPTPLVPDVPTRLGTSLSPVALYQYAYGEPASQTRDVKLTKLDSAGPTRRVFSKAIANVQVRAAHVVGSGTRWYVFVVLSKPDATLTAAYRQGSPLVARVDGMDAPVLATNDGPSGLPAYGFVMGDHRQAAEAAARTWTTLVTTTDRSA